MVENDPQLNKPAQGKCRLPVIEDPTRHSFITITAEQPGEDPLASSDWHTEQGQRAGHSHSAGYQARLPQHATDLGYQYPCHGFLHA